MSVGPITAAELRPSSDGSPPLVAPTRLEPLRIAGDKTILPDDRQSRRGTFKFCVDEAGKVAEVAALQTTGDDRYDAKIVTEMHRWAYQPVVVEGRHTALCSRITFIYNRR